MLDLDMFIGAGKLANETQAAILITQHGRVEASIGGNLTARLLACGVQLLGSETQPTKKVVCDYLRFTM